MVDRSILCVSTVLCLILTLLSLDLDQLCAQRSYLAAPTLLGNDATVNTGRSLAFLFSFSDRSYSFFCRGRSKFTAATMCHIQISSTLVGYCWHVVKPFIAVLVLYSSSAVVLWGAPYIGWAWTCMGLAMAGACAKHRPCYWSQTLTKQDILDIYSDVFTGIGKFPGMPYKFQLKPNAKPTRHAPRKVPIHLQDAFHKEIRNFEQLGILEETKDITEWVNSFVIVEMKIPTDSNSSQGHSMNKKLRICLDPRLE